MTSSLTSTGPQQQPCFFRLRAEKAPAVRGVFVGQRWPQAARCMASVELFYLDDVSIFLEKFRMNLQTGEV